MEELKAKHKKELKTFEADKRIALKKIKGTAGKGKKGKEALAEAEAEWDAKLRALEEKHQHEIQDLTNKTLGTDTEVNVANTAETHADSGDGSIVVPSSIGQEEVQQQQQQQQLRQEEQDEEAIARQKKLEKKLRKKKNALAKQKEKEEQIAKEMAEAPNLRQIEMNAIMELHLNKNDLDIEEVAADGNCLYRAIAKQMEYLSGSQNQFDYIQIRQLCAQELDDNRHEYEPFADLTEMKVSSFDEYVEKVRESNEWGGHLELRALAHKLKRTILIYSTEGLLEIVGFEKQQLDDDVDEDIGMKQVIRLSFHRQYYALGEHYNSVISRQVPRQ
jgi:OTU domain-containing protein 6